MSVLEINPAYYKDLFAQWTSADTSLPELPKDQKERLVALHFVMMAFQEGVDYSEEDLHQGIKDRNLFATDHIQIRLNLIINGFLTQTKDSPSASYRPSRIFLDKANWDTAIPGIS